MAERQFKVTGKVAIVVSIVLLLILVFSLKAGKSNIDETKYVFLGKNSIFGTEWVYNPNFNYNKAIFFFNSLLSTLEANKKQDMEYTECNIITDPLLRDLCYWGFIYEGYHTDVNPNFDRDLCYSMDNFFLSKICLRMTYRPHMLTFMTSPFTKINVKLNNISEECSDYDNYSALYCSYLQAAKIAKNDMVKASAICSNLKDQRIVGECGFYVATSLSTNIIKNPEGEIAKIDNFCKTISYPFWRSECYYLLADELGLLKYQGYNISLATIEKECTSSRKIADFYCYDHLLSFLTFEDFMEMCSLIDDQTLVGECYFALGKQSLRNSDFSTSLAIEECRKLGDRFRDECIKGVFTKLVRGTELLNLPEFSKICGNLPETIKDDCLNNELSKICNDLPENIKYECFAQLGRGTVVHGCLSSIENCVNKCSNLRDQSKEACNTELGKRLSWFSNFDIQTTINKCNRVPKEAKKECFEGIGDFLGDNLINNATESVKLCNQFPKEYKKTCFIKIGERIGHNFKYDPSKAVEKCKDLDKEPRELCYEGLRNNGLVV